MTLNLDFWIILELLSLWGLLKMNWKHFALLGEHKPLGVKGGMLWFENEMFPTACWGLGCPLMGFWEVTGSWRIWLNQWIIPLTESYYVGVIGRGEK
jgi:hypothetical protein